MSAVLYDCTRLIAQRNALTPTGIDRVDIHYLNHLLKQHGEELLGVFQYRDYLVALSFEELTLLRNELTVRWISGVPGAGAINPKLNEIEARLMNMGKSLEAMRDKSLIHPNVTKHLVKFGTAEPVYVNASHRGLDKETFMVSLKLNLRCKVIIFIHDIIPIDFPEYVSPGDDAVHKMRMANTSTVADIVIVNSIYTKERVQHFYRTEGYRCPKIEILHIGAEKQFSGLKGVANPLGDKKYFVTIGTIEPRKNHALLLNIWREWIKSEADAPYLVIIGKRGWHISTVTNMIDQSPILKSRVIEMSGLSDQDMVAIMQGSQALLFPSFVEGWGMPLAEALSMGVGAVCSNLSVFEECGQGLAVQVDPIDGAGWYSTLRKIHEDDGYREELRATARKYVSPSWGIHLAKLSELVTKVSEPDFENTEFGARPYKLKAKNNAAARLERWKKYSDEKEQELIATVPEVYKPNGKTFEDRYNLLGNVRCLRLAAEAYVQDGRIDDAIRVLKIAQAKEPKTKNINYRILVLKNPFYEKLLGNRRFEPYYYGKHEVSA